MRLFKVTAAVRVMGPRFMRSFEKEEGPVTEAEIELVVEKFRACFEEVVPTTGETAPANPSSES